MFERQRSVPEETSLLRASFNQLEQTTSNLIDNFLTALILTINYLVDGDFKELYSLSLIICSIKWNKGPLECPLAPKQRDQSL